MGEEPRIPASPPAAADWLLCFAVRHEVATALRSPAGRPTILLTGMGRRNAARAIEDALHSRSPRRVVTAGFAGGLNPRLAAGSVVFDTDTDWAIRSRLIELGATPARFHCASRVAVTAAEKQRLHRDTGADAVEMESASIRDACRRAGVRSATIRVISDAANEDLPLDFNAMMTPADRLNWWKLGRSLAARPRLIRRLIRFQRQTRTAAERLAVVLQGLLEGELSSCRSSAP